MGESLKGCIFHVNDFILTKIPVFKREIKEVRMEWKKNELERRTKSRDKKEEEREREEKRRI